LGYSSSFSNGIQQSFAQKKAAYEESNARTISKLPLNKTGKPISPDLFGVFLKT